MKNPSNSKIQSGNMSRFQGLEIVTLPSGLYALQSEVEVPPSGFGVPPCGSLFLFYNDSICLWLCSFISPFTSWRTLGMRSLLFCPLSFPSAQADSFSPDNILKSFVGFLCLSWRFIQVNKNLRKSFLGNPISDFCFCLVD